MVSKNKSKKNTSKQSSNVHNQGEYDLKQNFSKFNRYHSSIDYQTKVDKEQVVYNPPIDSRLSSSNGYDYITNQFGDSYFRLEDKITALSDKNDTAHDNLRKEFDGKIDKVRTELEDKIKDIIKDKKEKVKFIITTIVAVIAAIVGYFVLPYQKSSKNEKEIIRIDTRIEESIKPSIDRNTDNIEKNAIEIKSNYEKIILLQNNESKKGSK